MMRIVVGFDQREAVAHHTFCQSALEKVSAPVSSIPLVLGSLAGFSETHTDGSNTFIYSRFLTPCFKGYEISAMSNVWHQAYKRINQGMGV